MTILVLGAHPDDETLGCGGTINKLLENGHEVFISTYSSCKKSVPKELGIDSLKDDFYCAMNIMGIKKENLLFNDFPVREFPKYRQEILENMVSIKKRIKPDIVFTHSSDDVHQDHSVINRESIRAFKNSSSILGYELPWNANGFNSETFICLEEKDIEKKWRVLEEYKTQIYLKRTYFSKEYIFAHSISRGIKTNVKFAESFEIYKLDLTNFF